MKRLKPVKRRSSPYDKYDNAMTVVAGLWLATKSDTVPGLSRQEAMLSTLHAAAVYVERVMRESGTDRDRIRSVVSRGQKTGEDICTICEQMGKLDLPPSVGVAGDIISEILATGVVK